MNLQEEMTTVIMNSQELLYIDKLFDCKLLGEHKYAVAMFKNILPVQNCEDSDCIMIDNLLYCIKYNKYTKKDVFLIKI